MQYTINDLRLRLLQNVYNVYDIFVHQFGEGQVDLQGIPDDEEIKHMLYAWTDIGNIEDNVPIELSDESILHIQNHCTNYVYDIIVWWPSVKVSNENDKYVFIQDLYARVKVSITGKIPYENHGFQLTRATYDSIQYKSGYCHSHVPGFSTVRDAVRWKEPCLGRGPIRNTILELKNTNNEAEWMLFCQELALYVTVESLTGGPYRKLEEIGSTRILSGYGNYTSGSSRDMETEKLKDFISYYLKHGHATFNYQQGLYVSGMDYYDFMIDISNSFINWFNANGSVEMREQYMRKGYIVDALVADRKFFKNITVDPLNANEIEGTPVLTFKGNTVTLHITQRQSSERQSTLLLCHDIAMFIIQNILKIINYRYDNKRRREGEKPSTTYQNVFYL